MTERNDARDRAVRAFLPFAARDGWNRGSLRAGLAAAGEDPALVDSHFPTGPVGAILAWIDLVNREMEAAAAAGGVAEDSAAAYHEQTVRLPRRRSPLPPDGSWASTTAAIRSPTVAGRPSGRR